MARLATLVGCLLLIAGASAYPTLWVKEDGAINDCLAHPLKSEGAHPAPVADKTSTFKVTEKGVPVTALCPGGKYDVVVDFGAAPRRALLTTSAGTLGRATSPCLNRSYTLKTESALPTFTDVLTVPCNATATSADLKVTSATGKTGGFENASLKLAINALAKCPASICAAAKAPNATLANATATTAANETASTNATAAKELPGAAAAATAAPAAGAEATASPPAPAATAAKSSADVAVPLSFAAVAVSAVAALLAF